MIVARSRGTATERVRAGRARRRARRATSSAAAAGRWRRHADIRGTTAREHVEVREARRVAHAPPLGRPVAQHGERQQQQRKEERAATRSSRAGASRAAAEEPGERPQPLAARGEHGVVGAAAAQLARDLGALGRGGLGVALAQRRGCAVSTRSWRPVSGSASTSSPTSGSASSRGSRTSSASTPWRAASARSGATQSRGPRKSVTTTKSERERASAPAGAARRRARALGLAAAPATGPRQLGAVGRGRSACRAASTAPSRPARPWRGGRTRWRAPAEGDDAEPVAAPRGQPADRVGDALGDVDLQAVGGAERHRRRRGRARATWSPSARRRARARAARRCAPSRSSRSGARRRPGGTARICASSVPAADRRRALVAGDEALQAAAHGQVEAAERRPRGSARALHRCGSSSCRVGARQLDVRHRDRGSRTSSSRRSGVTPSASAS